MHAYLCSFIDRTQTLCTFIRLKLTLHNLRNLTRWLINFQIIIIIPLSSTNALFLLLLPIILIIRIHFNARYNNRKFHFIFYYILHPLRQFKPSHITFCHKIFFLSQFQNRWIPVSPYNFFFLFFFLLFILFYKVFQLFLYFLLF